MIAGATVSVINEGTNQRQTLLSDSEGKFRFAYLAVGDYRLEIEKTGFDGSNQKFSATVGQSLQIRAVLRVKNVAAQVEVGSEMPVIEQVRNAGR